MPDPCRRCHAARTEAEATAYGLRCEDCWVGSYPSCRPRRPRLFSDELAELGISIMDRRDLHKPLAAIGPARLAAQKERE